MHGPILEHAKAKNLEPNVTLEAIEKQNQIYLNMIKLLPVFDESYMQLLEKVILRAPLAAHPLFSFFSEQNNKKIRESNCIYVIALF